APRWAASNPVWSPAASSMPRRPAQGSDRVEEDAMRIEEMARIAAVAGVVVLSWGGTQIVGLGKDYHVVGSGGGGAGGGRSRGRRSSGRGVTTSSSTGTASGASGCNTTDTFVVTTASSPEDTPIGTAVDVAGNVYWANAGISNEVRWFPKGSSPATLMMLGMN